MHYNEEDEISSLLPDREVDSNFETKSVVKTVIETDSARAQKRANAIELARIKSREQRAAKNMEIYDGHEFKEDFNKEAVNERMQRLKDAVDKSKSTQPVVFVEKGDAAMAGVTRVEVAKLLTSLNINLNVQLTKTDTYNLLATLLTCNETQLNALLNNKKIPMAIKAVIKRIITDTNDGNISTIERLWDRVFGKETLGMSMPEGYQGILPNVPVSREAYVLIRETLIGK